MHHAGLKLVFWVYGLVLWMYGLVFDTIFSYIFHFGLQETVFRTVWKMHLSAGFADASKVCFEDLNKDISLESKMKHVVKYCVY